MSRYYKIVIGAETAQQPDGSPPSNKPGQTITNQFVGPYGQQVDLGAPLVELDIFVSPYATPAGDSIVTISGVGIQQIAQASDFNGAPISVYGGMQKGLPLATAAANQAGLLVTGAIRQAYGNWIGVNQSLSLVITPATLDGKPITLESPANLVLNWPAGQPMATAIKGALEVAFPGFPLDVNISPNLIRTNPDSGYFANLLNFGKYLKDNSKGILGGSYPGVDIAIAQGTIKVFDGTIPNSAPTALQIQDFMGQPTWISTNEMQFMLVMRADLDIGSPVTLPTALASQTITSPQSSSQFRDKLTFSGTWQIKSIHHVGNSRGPNALDWVSVFNAIPVIPAGGAGTGSTGSASSPTTGAAS